MLIIPITAGNFKDKISTDIQQTLHLSEVCKLILTD